MKTTPDREELINLIDDARRGKIVLPQFQRNFVWSASEITDLLVSIMHGYYIGTFLLLRTDANDLPFAVRPLEGVDLRQSDLRSEKMILDGQQRLTSLNYVFTAPDLPLRGTKYPYRFFLDLKKIAEGDFEGAVFNHRWDYYQELYDRQIQFERLQIPCTEIENWGSWQRDYERWLRDRSEQEFDYYWDNHRDVWSDLISGIRAFPVTTIEIDKISPDDPEQVAQVCAIFEKMNSTGVALSVYDLLTARMYRYKIDLHKLWEKSVEAHPLLNEVTEGRSDNYGVYLLRVIALLRGLDVKSRTLINLRPENFEQDWERAAHYMERALERMKSTTSDGFGVINIKWMPYSTMIAPMAALLAQIDHLKLGHHSYKLIRKWYWASALLERYGGAVESTIMRDYLDLMQAFDGAETTPLAFSEADQQILRNANFSLLEENRLNATYRAIMCMIALSGAKDFRADDSIEFHALDDHHIFPKAYLEKQRQPDGTRYPSNLVNSIVNRTLIASDTNRRISRTSPAEYLADLVPPERMTRIMASHFITAEAQEAMRANDFEAFLIAREEALKQEIRRQLTLDE